MRPKVIVHILQSIDGRISGGYFAHAMPYLPDYAEIRHELEGDAVMYGATTAEELFASPRPDLSAFEGGNVPAGDFVCETDSFHFLVLDPSGTLGYTSGTARRNDMEGHIVALLHHDVDPAYLAYLRSIGVSYVLAGWGAIDVQEALAKAGVLFGIRRVLLMGGGVANATVAAADCVDELSLVVAPVAAVESDVPTFFECVPGLASLPVGFELAEVRQLHDSGLWLHYVR